MPSLRHVQAIVAPALLGAMAWSPVASAQAVLASEIGARDVVGQGGFAAKVDRTVVSPFDETRRIVVRPGGIGGEKPSPVKTANDIGSPVQPALQASPTPAQSEPHDGSGVVPSVVFVDVGPYDALPGPSGVPIFPPD